MAAGFPRWRPKGLVLAQKAESKWWDWQDVPWYERTFQHGDRIAFALSGVEYLGTVCHAPNNNSEIKKEFFYFFDSEHGRVPAYYTRCDWPHKGLCLWVPATWAHTWCKGTRVITAPEKSIP